MILPFVPAEHKNRGLGEKKKPNRLNVDTIRYLHVFGNWLWPMTKTDCTKMPTTCAAGLT